VVHELVQRVVKGPEFLSFHDHGTGLVTFLETIQFALMGDVKLDIITKLVRVLLILVPKLIPCASYPEQKTKETH
jgi:hypothetical protein